MVDTFTSLRKDVSKMLQHKIRLRFYQPSTFNKDEWDDAQNILQSGNDVWNSGLALPIKNVEGSKEAVLLEQGKIKTTDKRLYILGNVVTATPLDGLLKIGIGSPTITEHSIVPAGEEAWPPTGSITYKKMFVRELAGGSFVGEQ